MDSSYFLYLCVQVLGVITICSSLRIEELQQLVQANTSKDQVIDWVKNIDPQATVEDYYRDNSVLGWTDDSQKETLTFRFEFDNSVLMRARAEIRWKGLSGREVIQCIGEPNYYNAELRLRTERFLLHTTFWYATKGLIAESRQFEESLTSLHLSERQEFSDITISKARSLEALVVDSLGPSLGPDRRNREADKLMRRITPWPGDWSKLESTDCLDPDPAPNC